MCKQQFSTACLLIKYIGNVLNSQFIPANFKHIPMLKKCTLAKFYSVMENKLGTHGFGKPV